MRGIAVLMLLGEYICFIDSDDFIEPDMLEKLYNECISENLDVIYSEFNVDNYPQYKVVLQPARLYQGRQEIEELQLDMIGAEPQYKSNVKFEPSACKGLYSMRIIREHNIYFYQNENIYQKICCSILIYFINHLE